MPASLCAQCKAVLVVKLSMRGVGTMVSTYHRSPVLGFMDEGASMQAVACPLSLISIALRSANGAMSISTYHMLANLAHSFQRNLA